MWTFSLTLVCSGLLLLKFSSQCSKPEHRHITSRKSSLWTTSLTLVGSGHSLMKFTFQCSASRQTTATSAEGGHRYGRLPLRQYNSGHLFYVRWCVIGTHDRRSVQFHLRKEVILLGDFIDGGMFRPLVAEVQFTLL